MRNSSPLRYPGGKSALSGLLADIRRLNHLNDAAVAEPYAGGAGASLSLLYREETPEIYVNDADESIHDFWWALVHQPDDFAQILRSKRASMTEWRRQRSVYRSRRRVSRLQRGFAAFYLNRCNRSGIVMNGGPIGGVEQRGKWKIGARFNKDDLEERCRRVAEYAERITVTCVDGRDLIATLDPSSTFFFIDPPYYVKGHTLYLNVLNEAYHMSLADQLREMSDCAWVLTYDDCPEIRRLYQGWATVRPFSLRYAAADRRSGKEVLITPRWVRLPERQKSEAIDW